MAASKDITVNSILVMRIFTLGLLAASLALMVTNNYKFSDGSKLKFTFLYAFRYVLATTGIGILYTLIQLPFAFYHTCTGKRLIRRSRFLPVFDYYGDKIISFLLASGVGVGFGVAFEAKRFINDENFDAVETIATFLSSLSNPSIDIEFFGASILEEMRSKSQKFLNRGIIASAFLLGAFICMAILTKLTSKTLKK